MLKTFKVSLLVLALSCAVYAGDMQNGDGPPVPSAKRIVEEPGDSIIIQEPQEATLTAAEIQLNLMQLVLGLF